MSYIDDLRKPYAFNEFTGENIEKKNPCKGLSIEDIEAIWEIAGKVVAAHNVVGGIFKDARTVANMMYVRGCTEHAIAEFAAKQAMGKFQYHSDEHDRIVSRQPYVRISERNK